MSVTKVTSLGSQYSASGAPTVPNPTPTTQSLNGDDIETPLMDFMAVASILEPIQEQLNESAEEASLPSPPINTPYGLSPAPSVTFQHRVRGFSVINDRLEHLRTEDRKPAYHDADGTYSNSNFSAERSAMEDENYEMASISGILSDGSKGKASHGQNRQPRGPLSDFSTEGSVPIALGSPAINPRIEEYLSFTSKDLPTKASLVENDAMPVYAAVHAMSSCSIKSDGVTEKSNWAEEVEDSVDHACMRLEQLAKDEHVADPSKTTEEYYVARLERLLGSRKRTVPVKINKVKNNHGQMRDEA